MTGVLDRLAATLREQGGLLAGAVVDPGADASATLGSLAASGPRVAACGGDLALVVEAVREGYLLHHARGRVLAPAEADLALLAGDQLYALGLARLAELGDLAAIAVLADVISLTSQACSAGDDDLAEAVWQAGVAEIGWGPSEELAAAKAAARDGDPGAAEALRSAARQVCGQNPAGPR